jgi:tRNA threonylcarbamoyladenosine biosynthesis protein TsaE
MEEIKIDITNFLQHDNASEQLMRFSNNEKVFLFDAPMGSGKTTFIKSLCKYLGVTDAVNSPTYSIVNEYHSDENFKIFHFDLYRINSPLELFEIGFEDYLNSKDYVFIEWPDLAMTYISNAVKVQIIIENNNRYIYARKINL